ncbi:uncharacterized protein Z520_08748 [Fonsecaea multimorphosa CBS 102226]|uniref:DNA polymerase lambda n=1 Tax=Fonsecaea multimorphosa CBS 102226 TaxID=1442371 RepID=A0A0D2KG28_9EURO|nr:uncharacterized protein Z520_08748 [Fonsecaea multimorphosa CBS 102226]KIX95628.1 hypothetical protein Z520_08748 [Fonsecaea multimorphosa CBS 102226]OAL21233.1 hypothetical protein AYO22_08196 [Fonsecaea multimorphosa]
MLSSEEKKEKDRFFKDLYRLDSLDDGESKTGPNLPERNPQRSFSMRSLKLHQTDPTPKMIDSDRHRRKRKLSQTIPGLEQNSRLQSLPPGASSPAPNPSKKKKPSQVKRNVTDLSNVAARMNGSGFPRLKPLPKRVKMKSIPGDEQIFKGLVFFFVPNNDDDSGTRIRIHQAIQYGAQWAHEFWEGVTHIIVTQDDLDMISVAKSLPSRQIPKGPVLLRQKWLFESWRSGFLLETHWNRFQVAGPDNVTETSRSSTLPTMNNGATTHVSNVDRSFPIANIMESTIQPQGEPRSKTKDLQPKAAEKIEEDALDSAIKDVQNGAGPQLHLASDEDSGDDDKPESRSMLDQARNNGKPPGKTAGFLCMERHDGRTHNENLNAETMEKLQEMATSYDQTGDQWRTKAFRQAIGKLRKQSQMIRTSHQARAVGIGESIGAQIEEIVSTGKYRRLEYAQNDPRNQIIKLFMGVYGAGETTAKMWIAKGYRSLEDVYQKAELTVSQRVGIEHYEDFQQRIPRTEVEQHAAVVEKALKAADPNFQLIIGGSYRRGSKDSGDIDCIIFMPEAGISHIRTLMLDTVIPKLMAQGFLKVALAAGHHSSDDSSKWHGASALPGSNVWRRIDFLFVPWTELGAALIYFTGNDLFNRSIRYLAGQKQMRLNQRGLFKDVMRGHGRRRINDGTLLEGHDERRIFEILGVPYRPPEERNV